MDHIPIEDIRQKILRLPEMFIGHYQWDTEALHALVGYVVDAALDPMTLNACTVLTVILDKSGLISINDNGRGMPISISWTLHMTMVNKFSLLKESCQKLSDFSNITTKQRYPESSTICSP